MSFLLLLLLTGFVIVVATVWIAFSLLAMAGRGFASMLSLVFNGRPRDVVRRCHNEKCLATLRHEARFCGRCGQRVGDVVRTRPSGPPQLRLVGGASTMTRVA